MEPAVSTDGIDELDGFAFERWVRSLFEHLGYETEQTSHWDPADLIATRAGRRIAVQVKHRSSRRWVGRRALDAVLTGRAEHECNAAIIVTNGSFAPDMKKRARRHDVELWDRTRLEELTTPDECEICGQRVSVRVREWCLSRPDEFNGRVFCFDHQHSLAGVLRVAD